jgi:hypothetical protein
LTVQDYIPGRGDPKVGTMLFVGAIGVILFVVSFIALQAYQRWTWKQEIQTKVYSKPQAALIELEMKQLEEIGAYRWIDPKKGTLVIPIERAMEIMATELKSRN